MDMRWFYDISTRMKLFIGFGLVILFLAAVIIITTRNIVQIEKAQEDIIGHEFANTVDTLTLLSRLDAIRVGLLSMTGSRSAAEKAAWHNAIKEKSADIDSLFKTLLDRNRDNEDASWRLREMKGILDDFAETRDRRLIPLLYAGKTEAARELAMGIQAERYKRMTSLAADLESESKRQTALMVEVSKKASQRSLIFSLSLGAAAVLFSMVLAVFLNNVIASPFKDISDVAVRVASGDLTVNVPDLGRRDEVGALSNTFRQMIDRLQRQTGELAEVISVLATSSNEIAATTSELASGAEQTAIAVTETTTTVEEVKQTANVSSEKARHVSDIAQNAVQVSHNGTRLVQDTLRGIGNIKEQVEYIAETIVKLSEHNQAIGEIIAAVDDLAEQANLLAVNASIEASKAGEHGKGFMVVAQEIKSLSEQSKQATRQVRSILNDIQKSSSAAVMATERGSKAVEATVLQSSGTGDTIRTLADTIGEASQSVIQIAASSQQQLVGMDQVAIAMNSIKQATTQTAASTKQVELTVRNLQELGGKLKAMVQHYKLS
ncbi:MAG TPA: methyl-accepting chemotaxis protein [Deltaproteobacteria bacterium]|nr:methyl-accepting chemotaxis protein [Deltaproteobacteria bacterium]HCY10681.1 methyl-accepting chemotaxis protein [Deltaproteobacteria bacterium]